MEIHKTNKHPKHKQILASKTTLLFKDDMIGTETRAVAMLATPVPRVAYCDRSMND